MDEAKLDRIFELIQQELVSSRAEVNSRFDAMHTEMDDRFAALRLEIAERFQSVLDRLDFLEQRVDKGLVVLHDVRVDVEKLKTEVYKLDGRFDKLQMSVNGLFRARVAPIDSFSATLGHRPPTMID